MLVIINEKLQLRERERVKSIIVYYRTLALTPATGEMNKIDFSRYCGLDQTRATFFSTKSDILLSVLSCNINKFITIQKVIC